jgi:hypothetical protein
MDRKKVAHRAATQATVARYNDHGSVTVGQSTAVEAVNQGRDVRDIADFLTERTGADLFLQDGAHPLEHSLTGLLAFVRLRGDVDHPTGFAEELLGAASRNDRWIGTG